MNIYYHHGFYLDDGITALPEQAVLISEESYHALLAGQSAGKQIVANEQGEPILIDPAPSEFHQLENGQWVISEDNQTALLEQRRQALIELLANKTDRFKSQILIGYPQAEIDSFYRQEREARAWTADNQSPTPMLSAIAENRGVPLALLCQKVIEKAELFAAIIGKIVGQRQAFEDRILQAEHADQLTQIEQEMSQWQFDLTA